MAAVDWAAINAHPAEFAAWVAGVQRNNATAAGVDPIYATVAEKYGYLAAYLNHAELGPILRRAAAEGWSAELLQGAISRTSWWAQKSAAEREWDLLVNTDIKTAQQKTHNKAMELQTTAAKMGIHFDDWKQVTDMAEALMKDPTATEADIQWMLGSQLHYVSGQAQGGTTGATMASIKQRASQYMVGMTDRRAFDMSKQIAMGVGTPEDVDTQLREEAKKQYAWLAKDLDTGATMKELFDTHTASIAQLLEVDPETIDLTDKRFRPIIENVDPTTGERRSMTTTEAEAFVRGTSQYDTTKGAMEKAATFSENLARTFGKVAV